MKSGKLAVIVVCLCLAAFSFQCGGGGSSGGSTPPGGGGGGPIALSSLSPIVAMQNGSAFTLTVKGSGFASGDQVVFNGSSESATVASSQQLTAQIPTSALSSPSPAGGFQVKVQGGGQTSGPLTFFVVPAISASTVNVSAGGTTSGVNISVPSFNPPSLQLQSIGGSTSGSATSAGQSAIIVTPGATLNLFIVGNGLIAGTFYEVTGGGVTVTQPLVSDFTQTTAPVSPAVNFSIVISPSATPGPRSLIVTNPAGEISIYPGGIVIAPGS
ncbi:MAG: hypothetical protein KGM47_04545 [Acidobacteriota bacterium]|nr:hypothetical protein [Acidobacteriota bacterium]